MKNTFLFLFLLLSSGYVYTQSFARQSGESKEDLIAKIRDDFSLKVGQSYEFKVASATLILYFEIRTLNNSKVTQKVVSSAQLNNNYLFSPFQQSPTATLFIMLYSLDGINFSRQVVDTVDVNSGCCPCHMPDIVDSLTTEHNQSADGLILYVTHPVRFDCNSVTNHYTLFYSDFFNNVISGHFKQKPSSSSRD